MPRRPEERVAQERCECGVEPVLDRYSCDRRVGQGLRNEDRPDRDACDRITREPRPLITREPLKNGKEPRNTLSRRLLSLALACARDYSVLARSRTVAARLKRKSFDRVMTWTILVPVRARPASLGPRALAGGPTKSSTRARNVRRRRYVGERIPIVIPRDVVWLSAFGRRDRTTRRAVVLPRSTAACRIGISPAARRWFGGGVDRVTRGHDDLGDPCHSRHSALVVRRRAVGPRDAQPCDSGTAPET